MPFLAGRMKSGLLRHAPLTACALFLLSATAGCTSDGPTGPARPHPPYIAVVAKVESGALPDPNVTFSYRVTNLSAGGSLDTTIVLAPTDTLILSVAPATYQIELQNLPAKCVSRYGTREVVVVPEGINTAISRFFITCNAPLAVTLRTLGGDDTFRFVWELLGPGGSQQTGFVDAREQVLIFNPLQPGDYSFSIYNVPTSCDVTSPGNRTQVATVNPSGGAVLEFSIICSQPASRPEVKTFKWSYHDGAAAIYLEAHDSDANLTRYLFDITDCEGESVLPAGAIERGALQSWHTYLHPDPVIMAGFEIGIPDSQMQNRCASIRLYDDFGNTTPLVERVQTPPSQMSVSVSSYNAILAGQTRLVTMLDVADPLNELAGYSLSLQLRDGVLGGTDGKPDVGVYNNQGFLPGGQIPEAQFGPGRKIQSHSDVFAQFLYVIDREGRFLRLVDGDLFR